MDSSAQRERQRNVYDFNCGSFPFDNDEPDPSRALVNRRFPPMVEAPFGQNASLETSREQNTASPSPPRRFTVVGIQDSPTMQNIWNPKSRNDITVHFEMEVGEDLDSWLEEFSRLKRLGHFHAAEQYFEDNLRDFSGILPVAIEYADMLVEQGAYKRLRQFISSHRELLNSVEQADREHFAERRLQISYRANLLLIDAFAAMHSVATLGEAYGKVRLVEQDMRSISKQSEKPVASIDSSEVRPKLLDSRFPVWLY